MQGYVTIANSQPRYVAMAHHLALSIAYNDPKRPIALLTDETTEIPPETASLFSQIVRMPDVKGFDGCLNKLRLDKYSPFDETFYIDADSLLIKPDMDRHWKRFATYDVNVAGDKVISGKWYAFDIAEAIADLHCEYLVKMNSGIIYFRRSEISHDFFELCRRLTRTHADLLACTHRREGQLADEPFLGAALGMSGIQPVGYAPEEGSIMVTTVGARRCAFDATNSTSSLEKPASFLLMNRFIPTRWVRHSPTIAHFVALKPRKVYDHACSELCHRGILRGSIFPREKV